MTKQDINKTLTQSEIDKLSSKYLKEGRKNEAWEIVHVSVTDDILRARVRMRSLAISPTDTGGFHLTIFSTLEFLSQLTIIYMHVWAGLSEKTREVWMLEATIKCHDVIRDPANISVVMQVNAIKQLKGNILINTVSTVSDGSGMFEIALKGFST